jgi:hypothetical protein
MVHSRPTDLPEIGSLLAFGDVPECSTTSNIRTIQRQREGIL